MERNPHNRFENESVRPSLDRANELQQHVQSHTCKVTDGELMTAKRNWITDSVDGHSYSKCVPFGLTGSQENVVNNKSNIDCTHFRRDSIQTDESAQVHSC